MDQIVREIVRFERFALDLNRGCALIGSQIIDLRPKTFEVLRHLAANAGHLVSKDDLYNAVWPGVIVGDDSLSQCIHQLRQLLGDTDRHLIKTISRRGRADGVQIDLSRRRDEHCHARTVLALAAARPCRHDVRSWRQIELSVAPFECRLRVH
jgi:DNA-binding winged helix-turn-helix (wHTH) protein